MRQLILVAYFFMSAAMAQQPAFNPEDSTGQLYQFAEFTTTHQRSLSLKEVINSDALTYSPLQSDNHDLGFTTNEYWVRFQLENNTASAKEYYLETARPITDLVRLYQINDQKTQRFQSGDQIPFQERQTEHRLSIFNIELPPNSIQQFYLQVGSDGETINLPLNLYTENEFLFGNYKQQLFLGLFYGILLLAGLIYMFFYTSLKEKTFLYYALYVFSIGVLQAALDGLIFQYVLPDGGYLNSRMVLIAALCSNFFLLKYCELFLKIKITLPSFKQVYNIIYGILGVLFLMIFVSPKTLALTYPISNINGLFSLLLILTSLFTLAYKRIYVDRYFSIGIFFLVIGLLGFVLNNLVMLPNNFYTLNSAKFGSGFEVIFLSLSMMNLIRRLRLQKEQSQELALQKSEEISEMKTYFMSNVSHEFRTPINAIMGIVQEQLGRTTISEEQKESYEIIKNASFSLLSNVNDVLDFEKIQKNELQLRNEIFEPAPLLQQISDNWQLEAKKKQLSYTFQMDPEIPKRVLGDADRFIQIINNVLGNAVKFTHTGSIKIKLKCTNQPDAISLFSFQISDTGVGMNEESKADIFNSYNQMRFNHKRKFGGIGLGLTIVKQLVDLFKGTIAIESTLNQGTDVYIEIPLPRVATPEPELAEDDTALDILIVEDNKLNQLVLRKMLASVDHFSSKVVENGQEALEELEATNYDLVLMDLQMPVMDGYEATEKIRSGGIGRDKASIPIIAVTADAMEQSRLRALELGMDDYMTKPVNSAELFEKIKNCMRESRMLEDVLR